MPSLKELPGERQVKSVRYCDRKYFVYTIAGDVLKFREFGLRFKTDVSDPRPRRSTPALLPAGGGEGDRSFLIFSDSAKSANTSRKIALVDEGRLRLLMVQENRNGEISADRIARPF